MKIKAFLTLLYLYSVSVYSSAQDARLRFLFVDAGTDFIFCENPDKDYIRADVQPYLYSDVASNIKSLLARQYASVRIEYRSANNKFGLSGGLRFSYMQSMIGKDTYWTGTPNFFYVRYKTDGLNTEYAKVRELYQRSSYIGIPLELRIYPNRDYSVNVYYIIGTSFNAKITSRSGITFYDDNMEQYKSEVLKVIEKPINYYSTLSLGIGLKIRKLEKTGIHIEAALPVAMFTPSKSFVRPVAGTGLQISLRFPFNKAKT